MEEATGGGDGVPDERLLSKMVAKWLMMLRLKARKLVPFLAELDLVMLGVGGEEEIEREIDTLSSSVKDILRVVREGILTLQCVLVNYNTQNTDNGLPALNTLGGEPISEKLQAMEDLTKKIVDRTLDLTNDLRKAEEKDAQESSEYHECFEEHRRTLVVLLEQLLKTFSRAAPSDNNNTPASTTIFPSTTPSSATTTTTTTTTTSSTIPSTSPSTSPTHENNTFPRNKTHKSTSPVLERWMSQITVSSPLSPRRVSKSDEPADNNKDTIKLERMNSEHSPNSGSKSPTNNASRLLRRTFSLNFSKSNPSSPESQRISRKEKGKEKEKEKESEKSGLWKRLTNEGRRNSHQQVKKKPPQPPQKKRDRSGSSPSRTPGEDRPEVESISKWTHLGPLFCGECGAPAVGTQRDTCDVCSNPLPIPVEDIVPEPEGFNEESNEESPPPRYEAYRRPSIGDQPLLTFTHRKPFCGVCSQALHSVKQNYCNVCGVSFLDATVPDPKLLDILIVRKTEWKKTSFISTSFLQPPQPQHPQQQQQHPQAQSMQMDPQSSRASLKLFKEAMRARYGDYRRAEEKRVERRKEVRASRQIINRAEMESILETPPGTSLTLPPLEMELPHEIVDNYDDASVAEDIQLVESYLLATRLPSAESPSSDEEDEGGDGGGGVGEKECPNGQKEDGEEWQRDERVAALLKKISLGRYIDLVCVQEEVGYESFLMLNNQDLIHMGLPTGPRKLILALINEMNPAANQNQNLPPTATPPSSPTTTTGGQ